MKFYPEKRWLRVRYWVLGIGYWVLGKATAKTQGRNASGFASLRFSEGDTREENRFYTYENIRRSNQLPEEVRTIAGKYGVTLARLMINWTAHRLGIACVLAGDRPAKQVKANAGAKSFSLSNDENEAITSAADRFSLAEEQTA